MGKILIFTVMFAVFGTALVGTKPIIGGESRRGISGTQTDLEGQNGDPLTNMGSKFDLYGTEASLEAGSGSQEHLDIDADDYYRDMDYLFPVLARNNGNSDSVPSTRDDFQGQGAQPLPPGTYEYVIVIHQEYHKDVTPLEYREPRYR